MYYVYSLSHHQLHQHHSLLHTVARLSIETKSKKPFCPWSRRMNSSTW
ncbi:unnamed protein product [Brassica rapa]|uniref:Uncharacterized protein n=2 Tax=Brassica TaxID=3705 RepID=A0A8D9M947_BRACM|nr:unnamed protein product [Brassica napus]CAG7903442.1 unnamed protein product [Brassica rapa]